MKTIPFYDGGCGTRYIQYCDLFAPFHMASRIVYIYNGYRVPIWFNTVSDITLPVYKKTIYGFTLFLQGLSDVCFKFSKECCFMKTIPLHDAFSVKYCNLFAPFDNPLRLIHLYHNNKLGVWLNPGRGCKAVYKKPYIDLIYFNSGYFIAVLNFPRSVSI